MSILGVALALNRPGGKRGSLHRPIQYLTGGTFSLYLYHKPFRLLLSVLTAITERKKRRWKSVLKRLSFLAGPRPVTAR